MNIKFTKAAQIEFQDAIDYYNEQSSGLGQKFAEEVKKAIKRITRFVNSYTKFSENTRRSLLKRFPYGIIYSYDNEEVLIIAIMHLHRKPGYWKSNLLKD